MSPLLKRANKSRFVAWLGFRVKVNPAFVVPCAIAASGTYYLSQLCEQSEYNYLFAIPVSVGLVSFSLLECAKLILARKAFQRAWARERLNLLAFVDIPEIRFASILVVYLVLFSKVPFIVLSFLFLLIGPLVLAKSDSARNSITWQWVCIAATITGATYLTFGFFLHAPL